MRVATTHSALTKPKHAFDRSKAVHVGSRPRRAWTTDAVAGSRKSRQTAPVDQRADLRAREPGGGERELARARRRRSTGACRPGRSAARGCRSSARGGRPEREPLVQGGGASRASSRAEATTSSGRRCASPARANVLEPHGAREGYAGPRAPD
jgi:hypothetical protein